jgi:hypothetical protein
MQGRHLGRGPKHTIELSQAEGTSCCSEGAKTTGARARASHTNLEECEEGIAEGLEVAMVGVRWIVVTPVVEFEKFRSQDGKHGGGQEEQGESVDEGDDA